MPGHRKRGSQKELVASVVEHVLVVAVSDPAPMLRATLINALSSRGCFLSVLKRPQLVRLLATVLNDGALQVRRAVIPLLGQLSPLNPSVVMGSLQKSIKWLIQVTRVREYVNSSQSQHVLCRRCQLLECQTPL